jgi:hypothetical protein
MDDPTIINLSGKPYRTFVGVVHEAHEKGLQGVHVDLVQIPDERNQMTAIVKATVRMAPAVEGGPERLFEDYGDANPKNCSARVGTALVRMATTRAQGRAMRVAIDSAHTLAEELGDMEGEPAYATQGYETHSGQAAPQSRPAAPADGVYVCTAEGCGKALTKGQFDVSSQKFSRPLCPIHQAEAAKNRAA